MGHEELPRLTPLLVVTNPSTSFNTFLSHKYLIMVNQANFYIVSPNRGGLSLRIIIWRIGEGGQASFTLGPKNYLGGPGYHLCVPLVVVTIHPLFPLLWPITGILIIVAQRMPLAEQELLTFLDLPISTCLFVWTLNYNDLVHLLNSWATRSCPGWPRSWW
jgi:hypothetical protein